MKEVELQAGDLVIADAFNGRWHHMAIIINPYSQTQHSLQTYIFEIYCTDKRREEMYHTDYNFHSIDNLTIVRDGKELIYTKEKT